MVGKPRGDPIAMYEKKLAYNIEFNKTEKAKKCRMACNERKKKLRAEKKEKKYKLGDMYFPMKKDITVYFETIKENGITDADTPQLLDIFKLSKDYEKAAKALKEGESFKFEYLACQKVMAFQATFGENDYIKIPFSYQKLIRVLKPSPTDV